MIHHMTWENAIKAPDSKARIHMGHARGKYRKFLLTRQFLPGFLGTFGYGHGMDRTDRVRVTGNEFGLILHHAQDGP